MNKQPSDLPKAPSSLNNKSRDDMSSDGNNDSVQPRPLSSNTASSKATGSAHIKAANKRWRILALLAVVIALAALVMLWQTLTATAEPKIQTVSREGIVSQMQQLNRLETIAYNVDTVITSQKSGSWQKLWQDEQKGLFIARGRVVAGIDLSKLGAQMVQVSEPTEAQIAAAKQQAAERGQTDEVITIRPDILITLPPAEIFSVYLDDIEVYDWQLGLFNMLEADPAILKQAQISAKKEVLERACQSGVMAQAEKNAKDQVQQLFALTGSSVTVTTQGAGACHMLSQPN